MCWTTKSCYGITICYISSKFSHIRGSDTMQLEVIAVRAYLFRCLVQSLQLWKSCTRIEESVAGSISVMFYYFSCCAIDLQCAPTIWILLCGIGDSTIAGFKGTNWSCDGWMSSPKSSFTSQLMFISCLYAFIIPSCISLGLFLCAFLISLFICMSMHETIQKARFSSRAPTTLLLL